MPYFASRCTSRIRFDRTACAIPTQLILFLILSLSIFDIHAQQSPLILSNINVVDVNAGKVIPFQTVIIEDGLITRVKPFAETSEAEKAAAIEMRGHFIMPGMVDAHIHLFQSGGLYTRPDVIDLQKYMPYEEEKAWLKANAEDLMKRYLRVGVTSVIDLGGPMYQLAMRDTLQVKPDLPNLWITGPLVSTYQPEVYGSDEPPIIRVDSAEAARELVREQLPHRPDFIKIWYIVFPGQSPSVNLPIVQATIDEAHLNGLKVAVHATQLETARLAVEAGADILVHSVSDREVDDAFIRLLLERGTVYIPTLIVSGHYDEVFGQRYVPTDADLAYANPWTLGSLYDLRHLPEKRLIEAYRERAEDTTRLGRMDRVQKANLKKLADAGVFIATGTDAGNIGTLHGSSYFEELDAMRDAGMTNAQVLAASTIIGAGILGKESRLGSIEEGKEASFVIYRKNPIHNLDAVKDPLYLHHRERFIRLDTFLTQTPAALAQRQLNAYNLRNLEAFLEPYDEDVRVFQYPSNIMFAGIDQMQGRYGEMFSQSPDLHCELVNRIVMGSQVIDHERIHGLGAPFEAIAIYQVVDGKIRDVRFIRQ